MQMWMGAWLQGRWTGSGLPRTSPLLQVSGFDPTRPLAFDKAEHSVILSIEPDLSIRYFQSQFWRCQGKSVKGCCRTMQCHDCH